MIMDITSLAAFSEETGFNTLVVTSNEPGYYSCIINSQSIYTFSVFDENTICKSDYWTASTQFAIDNTVKPPKVNTSNKWTPPKYEHFDSVTNFTLLNRLTYDKSRKVNTSQ